MHLFTNVSDSVSNLVQANVTMEMQSAIFTLLVSAAVLATAYLLFLKFPAAGQKLIQKINGLWSSIVGQKREARLNKVVCYHCNKGMGLYNPIYSTIAGEQHIEGTCSLCGGFVRVRLN